MTPACAALIVVLLGPADVINWPILKATIPRAKYVCLDRYGRRGKPCLTRLFIYENGRDYYAECGEANLVRSGQFD